MGPELIAAFTGHGALGLLALVLYLLLRDARTDLREERRDKKELIETLIGHSREQVAATQAAASASDSISASVDALAAKVETWLTPRRR